MLEPGRGHAPLAGQESPSSSAKMFSILETILSSVRQHRFSTFGDSVDRLNHQYTVLLLLLLALAVCAKQYVGEPIQCWLPQEYRDTWEQYVETFCFVESTYFIPLDERVIEHIRFSDMNYRKIGYYQWVPIVLAVQAALFYAPHALWKACSDLSGRVQSDTLVSRWAIHSVSGIRIQSIMKIAIDTSSIVNPAERTQRVRLLAQQIDRALHRQKRHRFSLFGLRHTHVSGLHLCTLYLLHKFCYLINAIAQFLILNSFLNTEYDSWLWGAKVLGDLVAANPIEWTQSGHFPRLAICNYPVRKKSETSWETAQCVLMINMLNEKIFVFLWFWLAAVFLLTLGNLLWTFWSMCRTSSVCRMVDEYLSDRVEAGHISRFVNEFLTLDGCLVLHFVQRRGDEVLSSELVDALFEVSQHPDLIRSTYPEPFFRCSCSMTRVHTDSM